jgi:hypothetical protein
MTLQVSPVDTLRLLARSMVAMHRYADVDAALRDFAVAAVRTKLVYYQRRIKAMERKHGADFDAFTARLEGRATPSEEDDWLAWRSAQRMQADWQQVYRELRDAGTR